MNKLGSSWFNEKDDLINKHGNEKLNDIGEEEIKKIEKKELPPPSSQEKKEAHTQQEILQQDDMDLRKISDIGYLYDIFAPKYDKYGSLNYIKKTKENMLREGYLDGPILNEYLFWATLSRRFQIEYQRIHASLHKEIDDGTPPENIEFLDRIQKIADKLPNLQKILDIQKERTEKIRDVVDLHAETMADAERYLKEHMGEFTFMDPNGEILTADAKAHWAFLKELNPEGELQYFTWSEELFYLFGKGLISIEHICLALRTSPEGILWIAKQRNIKLPKFDKLIAEKKLRELMIEFEELQFPKQI